MATVTVLMQPGVADWEFGPVLALLRKFYDDEVVVATPEGSPVESIGGVRVEADRMFDTAGIDSSDLVVVIGSDTWITASDANLETRLRERVEAGKPTAAICGGTLALARAGVFDTRAHTSNALEFLTANVEAYAGSANYRDVPHAIVDGAMITAPASAASSFASAVAAVLHPDQREQAEQFWTLSVKEVQSLGAGIDGVFQRA